MLHRRLVETNPVCNDAGMLLLETTQLRTSSSNCHMRDQQIKIHRGSIRVLTRSALVCVTKEKSVPWWNTPQVRLIAVLPRSNKKRTGKNCTMVFGLTARQGPIHYKLSKTAVEFFTVYKLIQVWESPFSWSNEGDVNLTIRIPLGSAVRSY